MTFRLNAMDAGNYVETLYTDFSKAFDRIDIPLLLHKLQKYGITHTLLEWLKSYLTNRVQVVRFQNILSEPINVTSGVPQGSHLGPLLFILHINDISFILKNLKVLIYADDMKLFMEIKNINDAVIFQNEINLFHIWCCKSLLQLNVKKCNLTTFSRKNETISTNIHLGNQLVEKCKIVRDLGVILDSKLTFVEHYNTINNKANSMLGFIKRFSHNFQDPYTIKLLYTTYVRPILEYCSLVWNPYNIIHEERIESIQRQFLLYALRKLNWTAFPLSSYEARCMLISIQTLKERRDLAMLYFISDIISQRIQSPSLLSQLNFYTPSPQLRTRKLFLERNTRTNYAKYSPINRRMRHYNQYCEHLDLGMSKNEMKFQLSRRNNA
ncbi:probable RNA-directed DNA polymerase from transposon X-element isoform X1 [Malaya genurostris]|uniref:probable RNA-directed DNA polymerase from transposon X-element isoform X1 n=1 Tax=Malaya genurostris TaxID=325434 RepID=UPI0026F3FD2C|nr:probable RNA-directed DNA polymerase from transposon X-element isoform X1 [Malaya genurostris]